MKIAFYAPLKSPHHPVPSGDRLMARLLIAALRRCGHAVSVASEFRSFSVSPTSLHDLQRQADKEIDRLDADWQREGPPDCWFSYHPYYKSPDLIGPVLCRRLGMAYVTAEASYSPRRNAQGWQAHQALLADALQLAAVNLCLTGRDLAGLAQAVPDAVVAHLPPFIDTALFADLTPAPQPAHLVTVAMMRPGDKMSSYGALAAALHRLEDLPWRLSIIGDGPSRDDVRHLFAAFSPDRIIWHGQREAPQVAECLAGAALHVWPGHGEAYGLAYLEAQAAGLPVVAENIAGVPEVVVDGRTGLLTPPGDVDAYAAAIRRLLTDETERQTMARQARRFVLQERSLDGAAAQLKVILDRYLERHA